MKKLINGFVVLLIALLSTGCANWRSIHRDINPNYGNGALIDIKQRAILSTTEHKERKKEGDPIVRICAEPSPDALSAYADDIAAKSGDKGVSLSFKEMAAYIGVRSQNIQLMRDSMYRNCEAYMSGGIDGAQFNALLLRSQKFMAGLLAIEQITGAVVAPPVVLGNGGRTLTEIRKAIEDIDKELDPKKTGRTTKQASLAEQEKIKVEDRTPQQKEDIKQLTSGIDTLKKEIDRLDLEKQNLEAMKSMPAGTMLTVTPSRSQVSAEIATVVERITKEILNSDIQDACVDAFRRLGGIDERLENTNKDLLALQDMRSNLYISKENNDNEVKKLQGLISKANVQIAQLQGLQQDNPELGSEVDKLILKRDSLISKLDSLIVTEQDKVKNINSEREKVMDIGMEMCAASFSKTR